MECPSASNAPTLCHPLTAIVSFGARQTSMSPRKRIREKSSVSRMKTDAMGVILIYYWFTSDLITGISHSSWIFRDLHGFSWDVPCIFKGISWIFTGIPWICRSKAPLAARVRGAPAACHGAPPAHEQHRAPPWDAPVSRFSHGKVAEEWIFFFFYGYG